MSNQIQLFTNSELNISVETIILGDIIYFNARHIADALEISQSTLSEHLSTMSEKQVVKLTNEIIFSAIGLTDTRKLNNFGENFLTESGVYKLIMKSRKPSAEKVQDWLAEEVMPAIRKHGVYATTDTLEKMIANPRYAAELLIKLAEEKEAKLAAEKEAKIADAYNHALKSELGQSAEYASVKKVLVFAKKCPEIAEKIVSVLQRRRPEITSIHYRTIEQSMWSPLKKACQRHGLQMKEVPDVNYGTVNAYPATAWDIAYGIDIIELFGNRMLVQNLRNKF